MDLEKLASIFEAARIVPLRPNDLLVFRASGPLGVEQMAQVHAYLEEATGHPRILVLDGGCELSVLRREPEPAPEPEQPRPVHRPIAPKASSAPGAIS